MRVIVIYEKMMRNIYTRIQKIICLAVKARV